MHRAPGILPPRWKMVKVPHAEEQENWRVNLGGIWGVREAVDLLGMHLSASSSHLECQALLGTPTAFEGQCMASDVRDSKGLELPGPVSGIFPRGSATSAMS